MVAPRETRQHCFIMIESTATCLGHSPPERTRGQAVRFECGVISKDAQVIETTTNSCAGTQHEDTVLAHEVALSWYVVRRSDGLGALCSAPHQRVQWASVGTASPASTAFFLDYPDTPMRLPLSDFFGQALWVQVP